MEAITIRNTDGFLLKGDLFMANARCAKGKIIIINSATGVRRQLYANYAEYMAENGFDVLTYDYRGIAESRPRRLRGFKASFTIWGQHDFTAVLDFVQEHFPQHKIGVLGHSIGGTIIGMSEKCSVLSGILTIGAQTAYYKDWDKQKIKLYFLWHGLFPLITAFWGYFPGKKLRLLEDIPKGVVTQWNSRKYNPHMVDQLETAGHKLFYHTYTGKLLTLAIKDDSIGTEKALKRVYDLFTQADHEIERVEPKAIGVRKIGHFGFFSRKFKDTLWEKSLRWYEKI